MYILTRSDDVIAGVEPIAGSTGGNFRSGYISEANARQFGDGYWTQEITKEEAHALKWCWKVNSFRVPGDVPGELIKTYPTDDELESAFKVSLKCRKKQLADVYEKKYVRLKGSINGLEQETWPSQLEEAKAFLSNPSANTPILDILLRNRDIDKTTLVGKIIKAHDSYVEEMAKLLNQQQAFNDRIDACTTLDELADLNPEVL